jgi:hypothetical protein
VRFAEHDVGRYCDLIVRPDSTLALVFMDADTQALLLYEGPVEGGGTLSLVDAGTPGQRGFLGAELALALDVLGEPVVAYQDQTQNDLRWTAAGAFSCPVDPSRRRGPWGSTMGWRSSPTRSCWAPWRCGPPRRDAPRCRSTFSAWTHRPTDMPFYEVSIHESVATVEATPPTSSTRSTPRPGIPGPPDAHARRRPQRARYCAARARPRSSPPAWT